jgi:hypothetical protein
MIPRFPLFLLLLFVWSLIPAQAAIPADAGSRCPLVETQEIIPLALKYRENICQQIEASFLQIAAMHPDISQEAIGPIVVVHQSKRWTDPCYGFMSMQL